MSEAIKASTAAIQVSRVSLLHNQPRPDVAARVHPEAEDQGKAQARALYSACLGLAYVDQPKDRDGSVALCRVTRDNRSWWTTSGNTLRGIVRSALMSAFFESEGAARAWNRFVEAEAKADAEHGADHQDVDGQDNGLDLAAQRAMDAVAQAAVMVHFAAELARMVEEAGDGELMQVEYSPKARADGTGRPPAPKAAANLRQMLRGS